MLDAPAHFYPVRQGSFWTHKQRQGHSLNEISYRACFKPQLPQYFIEQYSKENDVVLDPFMGRGTTPLQAALSGRIAYGSDINPLSAMLTQPRLSPPKIDAFLSRFESIPNNAEISAVDADLLVFYHPKTLKHLLSLKQWFLEREKTKSLTNEDQWIRMVIINRLSGHSGGFLSVKTMPPNQAISIDAQRKINEKHGRIPDEKDIGKLILKKSKSLLRDGFPQINKAQHKIHCCNVLHLDYIENGEVDLLITSPPFMNVVDYAKDNWLRCWFAGIDSDKIMFDDNYASVEGWGEFVRKAFTEFARVVKSGGHIAFEVGEVQRGAINLEENVIASIEGLDFEVKEVLVNKQKFTKTANCWGVDNNTKGTNTNRIVVARRQ